MFQSRSNFKNSKQCSKKFFFLDEKMFPSIGVSTNISNDLNFVEKLKSKEKIIVDELKPGWIEIKYNPKTCSKEIRFNPSLHNAVDLNHSDNLDHSDGSDVIDKLYEKYVNWQNKYIEMWGEEEYEKIFKFPNYDYDYFDTNEPDSLDID